ncbi:unnamed protein product [Cuscuta epithymum]|uniref:Retrotransposon Copia-like N-terminal domain-containing protein n=1 Tax=Cuscuta epithymum TaxID=186058 RepID=A0AAV0F0D2_9ASTE|nr:unnamed protein product [Cuscuta epithymum]
MSQPDHVVNPSNPYFLHPGENPAIVLVTPPLSENNYHQWKRDMVVALESKNKEKFIFGTLPCPPSSDPLSEAWKRCNRMVMSWLIRSMNPSIKQSVMWMDTASEIWKDIQERFSHADKFRIADLQDQIQTCKQGISTVSEYYTRLNILWKELELYRCNLLCTCATPCSCDLIKKLKKEREDDCIIRFLRGLNDTYAPIRSQLMILDHMPSIIKIFNLVLQHEREFVGDPILTSPADTVAFINSKESVNQTFIPKTTQSNFKSSNINNRFTGKGNKLCTHCGKTNHTIETCYHKHGFPAGYKTRGRNNSSVFQPSASLAEVDTNTAPQHSSSVNGDNNDQFTLSKDQYNAIIALLQQTKFSPHSSSVNHIEQFRNESSELQFQED